MYRTAKSLGLSGAGLFLHVSNASTNSKKERRVLALPAKGAIPAFVRGHVRPFLARIASQPGVNDVLIYSDDAADFRLEYRASERTISGAAWAVYTNPRTSTHNPLYRRLEKKAGQLRSSGFAGRRGVFVCDGGCDALAGNVDEIVHAFFRRHRTTIQFVVIVDVPDRIQQGRGGALSPRCRMYWGKTTDEGTRKALEPLLDRITQELPRAVRASRYTTGRNFKPDLRYHGSREGAYSIDSDGTREVIRVSARSVLQALAGNIRHRPEFFPTGDFALPVRIFQAQIAEGRSIKAVSLERSAEDDDDWLVLEFDDRDAAVSAFQSPASDRTDVGRPAKKLKQRRER